MEKVELFAGGLLAIVLLVPLARRIGVPAPAVLVVGGVGIGTLPFAPDVRLDPELIFLAFLPPILYPAAFRYAGEDLRGHTGAIGLLAVGLVAVTIGAVAVVAHLAGLPWGAGFVLGAVLAPTDPVAAVAVLRRVGAPERVVVILEGESLVNDGLALTAFRLAVAAAGAGTLAVGHAALQLVGVVAGGVAIGWLTGWLVVQLRRRLDFGEVEITVSLLAAYATFAVAEQIGVSGILATVVAGYMAGRHASRVATPETRIKSQSFWDTLSFLAESALFLLIGLRFPDVVRALEGRSIGEVIALTLAVTATLVIVRAAWVFGFTRLVTPIDAEVGELSRREQLVLAASGMRGAVSAAAALAVPLTAAGGGDFPERDVLLIVTFGAVLLTLVVPAVTLEHLLRALGLHGDEAARQRTARARVDMAEAAIRRADELAGSDGVPESLLQRAREAYEFRISRLSHALGGHADPPQDAKAAKAYKRLRHKLVEAERAKLEELRESGDVAGEVARDLERGLDLEDARYRQ